jgi:hypothetical protein
MNNGERGREDVNPDNHFQIEGRVWQVWPKKTQGGKRFYVVMIETDYGETVPVDFWTPPPRKNVRVRIEGRLVGYKDYPKLKITMVKIFSEAKTGSKNEDSHRPGTKGRPPG